MKRLLCWFLRHRWNIAAVVKISQDEPGSYYHLVCKRCLQEKRVRLWQHGDNYIMEDVPDEEVA
jgi:hypothetical protein